MSDNLLPHLSRWVASSLARQLALADLLQDRSWAVNIRSGTATFGADLTFGIQLLGTESDGDGTWLWAWANLESDIPPALVQAANWIRDYGQQHHIQELTEANLPLDHADGHKLALLSGGLTGRCYYRGLYSGGALFFLLEGVPASVLAPAPPERVATVLTQAIQMYELDHRTLVDYFLNQQGYAVESTATAIAGRSPDGAGVRVEFDDHGRIRRVESQIPDRMR